MASVVGGGEKREKSLSGVDGISSCVYFEAAVPLGQNGFHSPICSARRESSEQNLEHLEENQVNVWMPTSDKALWIVGFLRRFLRVQDCAWASHHGARPCLATYCSLSRDLPHPVLYVYVSKKCRAYWQWVRDVTSWKETTLIFLSNSYPYNTNPTWHTKTSIRGNSHVYWKYENVPYKNTMQFAFIHFICQAFGELLLMMCYEESESGRKTFWKNCHPGRKYIYIYLDR